MGAIPIGNKNLLVTLVNEKRKVPVPLGRAKTFISYPCNCEWDSLAVG
jgi:hypothetical protein